jgi:NADH-quinone oxidoreductase subunit C
VAQRPRPGGHTREAEAALSERAQELQHRVQDVLADFHPEAAAAVDTPTFLVPSGDIVEVCRKLRDEPTLAFSMLLCIAAVDYTEHIQVVYVLLSMEHEHKLLVKTNVPTDAPRLPSLTALWPAADWHEREAHDLFGVEFEGHPNLSPLLLYESFEGYPGRKDHPFHDYQEF